MYAWHVDRNSVRAEMEAELLIELLMSWTGLVWGSPDSFDSVRELGRRIKVLPEKAALCFCCEVSGVLLGREGAFHVSIHCYDTA